MSASIVLCDVQLDDIRPDRQNFITKYVPFLYFVYQNNNIKYADAMWLNNLIFVFLFRKVYEKEGDRTIIRQ